jgi:hypothetical protein
MKDYASTMKNTSRVTAAAGLLFSLCALMTGCTNQHIAASTPPTAPPVTSSAPQTEALQQAPQQHIAPTIVSLAQPAPVLVSNRVRETNPNDFLRVSFFPKPTNVTSLGRPGAVRAFATATAQYMPPLTLQQMPLYSGLEDQPNSYMVALRCRAPNPALVDATLATWPNVFAAILRDHPVSAADCAAPTDPATQVSCFAKNYTDTPGANVPILIAEAFKYASTLYDPAHTALAQWLQSNYGIYPAFSGLGYSAKDTYNLSVKSPITTQQILVGSISSEYLLKNDVTLSQAGCHCIAVAPYPGRSNDPLDPDFIDQAGGNGSCTDVPKLLKAQ